MERIRFQLNGMLEKDDGDNIASRRFDVFLTVLIFLNMVAVITETVDVIYDNTITPLGKLLGALRG